MKRHRFLVRGLNLQRTPHERASRDIGRGTGIMKEPVDHILRPRLPWRSPKDPSVTECGYDASKVQTITRDAYFKREKELGRQRCAMLTYMTCADTAKRWGTWEDDPRLAMQREIAWERGGEYWSRPRDDRGRLLRDELEVIASMIEQHREEFENQIATLIARREWHQKKIALEKRPKQRESGGL